jgi:nucleotide-binding universal stress UspA family protein
MNGLQILVPLDPTKLGSRAIDVAVGLAGSGGAVELVSVTPATLPGAVVDTFLTVEREQFADADVRCRRLEGADVVGALLEHIAGTGPDLVVLDSHGRGPLGELVLGSISADLVRSSHSPTVLVGPACAIPSGLRQLTVAVDGSPDALGALQVASRLSQRIGAALELVEVAEEVAYTGDVAETAELHRIAELVDPPVRAWDVLHGRDVAKALVGHLGRDRDVMLVVGSHGRSEGRPHPLGGTAARAVRQSPVPVLVVSPEAAADGERRGLAGSSLT